MKHKLLVLLIVMITTLATAQEGLRHFDSLKAEAEAWATSRLLTGFLDVYAQDEENRAVQPGVETGSTCAVEKMGSERLSRQDDDAQRRTVKAIDVNLRESARVDSQSDVEPVTVEVPVEQEHHPEAAQTVERSPASDLYLASLVERPGEEHSPLRALRSLEPRTVEDAVGETPVSSTSPVSAPARMQTHRSIGNENIVVRRVVRRDASCTASSEARMAQAKIAESAKETSTADPRLTREIEKLNAKLALDLQHVDGVTLNAEALRRIVYEYGAQRRATRRTLAPVVQRPRPLEG